LNSDIYRELKTLNFQKKTSKQINHPPKNPKLPPKINELMSESMKKWANELNRTFSKKSK
jgi:hypothetical protein